jgi:hypothetical protein
MLRALWRRYHWRGPDRMMEDMADWARGMVKEWTNLFQVSKFPAVPIPVVFVIASSRLVEKAKIIGNRCISLSMISSFVAHARVASDGREFRDAAYSERCHVAGW